MTPEHCCEVVICNKLIPTSSRRWMVRKEEAVDAAAKRKDVNKNIVREKIQHSGEHFLIV